MLKKYCFHLAAAALLTFSSATVMPAFADDISGTVLETMNSGGYTYMLVDSTLRKEWVAIPETTVATGDAVSYSEGMVMNDFYSKTLDRTFPTIIFSGGITQGHPPVQVIAEAVTEDSFAAAVAQENMGRNTTQQQTEAVVMETSGGSTGAIVPFAETTVEKAAGDNGYTIDELFSNSKELNTKTIRVRGKVVKFSPSIMGRNWVHIQDGTGNPMNNSHDLVITMQETVAVDDVVLFEGVLADNKDFGAGYKYATIIEDAKIIK